MLTDGLVEPEAEHVLVACLNTIADRLTAIEGHLVVTHDKHGAPRGFAHQQIVAVVDDLGAERVAEELGLSLGQVRGYAKGLFSVQADAIPDLDRLYVLVRFLALGLGDDELDDLRAIHAASSAGERDGRAWGDRA